MLLSLRDEGPSFIRWSVGKVLAAVIAFGIWAQLVGVPKSRVNLVSGLKSKQKSVVIELPEEAAAQLVEQLTSIGH